LYQEKSGNPGPLEMKGRKMRLRRPQKAEDRLIALLNVINSAIYL
jgi:hypothetical protein